MPEEVKLVADDPPRESSDFCPILHQQHQLFQDHEMSRSESSSCSEESACYKLVRTLMWLPLRNTYLIEFYSYRILQTGHNPNCRISNYPHRESEGIGRDIFVRSHSNLIVCEYLERCFLFPRRTDTML